MSNVGTIYELEYRDLTTHIVPNPEWWYSEMGKTWCKNCRTLRRELYPKPIDVCVGMIETGNPIGFVSRAPIGVIRNDLRDVLRPWLRGFVFGRCFERNNVLIATHSTFYSREYVHCRGGPGSIYKLCSQCGAVSTREMLPPECYMVHEIGDKPLVHDILCDTLVSEEVCNVLRAEKIRGLRIQPYPVVDRPSDGWKLPNDPPDWSGKPLERL
ncbi:MAG TPA: hypothetical protein PLS24_04660 [Sedimentisphaerales bacterium]|nr:hypothetical protein [Sedimentisphaerales bacterium]